MMFSFLKRTGKLAPALIVFGAIALIIIGIVGWVVVPIVITNMIRKEARLENGTDTWEKWRDLPVPIYFNVYVFHVTNADDVEKNGATPILEERGPYAYLEERHKVNISINGDLISYKQTTLYTFDREKSVGSDSDTFDTINIPFVSAASLAHQFLGAGVANLVLGAILLASGGKESIIKRNVTVREFMFTGYNVRAYTGLLDALQEIIPPSLINLRSILPKQFIGDTFALYNGRNGTDVGEYTIYSGVDDYMLFGEIFAIDGQEYLDFWSGKTCDMINGTDTTIFHSSFNKDQSIKIFHGDVCRSFTGYFDIETEYEDIPAYRFVVPEDLLTSPIEEPDHECFCPEAKNNYEDNCLRTGAIRLSSCYTGAPLVFSLPHFLYADPFYLKQVEGLEPPTREKYETYVDMEHNTGMVLRGYLRAQFNIDLIGWKNVIMFSKVKSLVFPFMWIEEGVNLNDELVDDLKDRFLKPVKIVTIVKWTLGGLSAAVTVFGVGLLVYKLRNSK